MSDTKKAAKRPSRTDSSTKVWTDEERSAMQERAKELKSEARASKSRADGERDLLAKIKEMPKPDRVLAERIHAIVTKVAPELAPRTWYGMPAYAKNGRLICFFQPASKFKARYSTFGFENDAQLDDGSMWPTAFALTKLTASDEARIGELVKKAVS